MTGNKMAPTLMFGPSSIALLAAIGSPFWILLGGSGRDAYGRATGIDHHAGERAGDTR